MVLSRSYRKTPIFGITTCRSEKRDKKAWHGKARAMERVRLCGDPDAHLTTLDHEAGNPWSMGKDGKLYYTADMLKTAKLLGRSRRKLMWK